MTSNFTTGIPEIDRLIGSEIENGSFFLITGNDDEGMSSFSAEIIKSNGRSAKKEKNENADENDLEILKIDSNESVFRRTEHLIQAFEKIDTKNLKTEVRDAENDSKKVNKIIFIESLSELFQTEPDSRKTTASFGYLFFVNWIKETKSKNSKNLKPKKHEDTRYFVIGCLRQKILPKKMENRLIHLSDQHLQFKMQERNGKIEREIRIWKYHIKNEEENEKESEEEKEKKTDINEKKNINETENESLSDGGKNEKRNQIGRNRTENISGTIFQYEIENNKIRIENKKRIY